MFLKILIILVFTVIAFISLKLGTKLFIGLSLFLPPSFAILDVSSFPLISEERALIAILFLAFIFNLIFNLNKLIRLKESPLGKPFLILYCLLIFPVLFTHLDFSTSLFQYLSSLFEEFFIFRSLMLVLKDDKDIKHIFFIIFFSFFIITIYGIFCHYSNTNPFIDFIQESEKNSARDLIYSYSDQIRFGIRGRLQSVFNHPMTYGAYLAIVLLIIVPFIFLREKKFFSKTIYFFLIILLLLNLLFVNSRSPYVLFLGGLECF